MNNTNLPEDRKQIKKPADDDLCGAFSSVPPYKALGLLPDPVTEAFAFSSNKVGTGGGQKENSMVPSRTAETSRHREGKIEKPHLSNPHKAARDTRSAVEDLAARSKSLGTRIDELEGQTDNPRKVSDDSEGNDDAQQRVSKEESMGFPLDMGR